MQLTDFKIGDGTGLIAANLKSHHHKIRILQRSSLLAMAANFTVGADGIHQLTHHNMRLFQAGRIDIHQRNVRRFQRRALKNVTENIFDENR